jgi:hypothetical protein
VSFVKPSGLNDGHPASSKWTIFEAFVGKILTELRANPDLWNSTAVFITTDEGGGYYDSGYIQPLDFFGDSVRIPLLVVSPWSKGGHVNHSYAPQPRQSAEPGAGGSQSVRAGQRPGDRRPDGCVQLQQQSLSRLQPQGSAVPRRSP